MCSEPFAHFSPPSKKDGQEKLTFPDGNFWEGLFSNDERTDQGKMTFIGKAGAKPAAEAVPDGKP